MNAHLLRARLQAADWLSHNPAARHLAAMAELCRAAFHRNPSARRAARLRAIARIESPLLARTLGGRPAAGTAGGARPVSPRNEAVLAEDRALSRSLVLKPPCANGERGVLLVQFEYNWYRLLAQVAEWDEIERQYDVIWGTSWSPTDFALLDWILRRAKGPVIVLPSHQEDASRLAAFDSRIRCPDVLSACDWLDPACFAPKPRNQREIDILMVANWAPFKRHFELFLALRKMPRALRVVLIGQPEARHTEQRLRELARSLGVPQDLEIHERLPVATVHQLQCNARTALILSRREGSCVAAVEALFADAPLGMRADAHVGALAYVNEQTGMRLAPGKLARELPGFLERASSFEPRRWAESHVTFASATEKLNAFMKSLSRERGLPWTGDLAAIRWNPYPEFLHDDARAAHIREWSALASRWPGAFGLPAQSSPATHTV